MLDLWALFGFVGPLPVPPVIPPGPFAGALLVGLAVYNVLNLLQPPSAPNNSRGKNPPDLPDGWPASGEITKEKYTGGTLRFRHGYWPSFSSEEINEVVDSAVFVGGPVLGGGGWSNSGLRKTNISVTGFEAIKIPGEGNPYYWNRVYFDATFEGGIVSQWYSESLQARPGIPYFRIYNDPAPANPEYEEQPTTPTNFQPPPYFPGETERRDQPPLAPPGPTPATPPPAPQTPDKAKPTEPNDPGIKEPEILEITTRTPDGRPEPYEYQWFGLEPEPVQIGNPSRPTYVTGGTVTTGGVTRAAEANTGQVNTPSRRAVPSYTPTTNDGQVQPQPAPGPNTTQAGQKTIAGTQVQPLRVPQTIAGVAQELGRVESKLETLLRGQDRSGNKLPSLDDLADILNAVRFIVDLLTNDVGEKNYEMTAPCDKDAEGNPLKFQRSFPAEDYGPATLRRTEAILDALATLARWKHRTCAPMGGQPVNNVTITAYEVMES